MTEETIFAAVLQKQGRDEQQAFLDEACGNDESLRRRVEALLGLHEHAGPFLQTPALEQMAACKPADSTAWPEANAAAAPGDRDPVLGLLDPARRPGALGRLKHYEVLDVLGKGAFGTVLKVFDERLHRVVAVKVLAPFLAGTDHAPERFLREARAAAAVRHDHVINIHAVEDEPQPYLVMEYIEGQNLQQKLDRMGRLPIEEVLRIGYQVAAGLAAAHKQGLIHRDIKPSNILLENGVERVKLSDFGLARAVDDASLSDSGVIAGTPLYMSPEQARGEALDQRSDLFSLGSVLYALCTGAPPFKAGSTLAVLRCVCDDVAPSVCAINSEVPGPLGAVIAKLLAKKPAERFQTATEVADLLAKQLAELQGHGAISAETQPGHVLRATPAFPRGVRGKSNHRVVALAATFLAVLAAGGYLFVVRPWARSGGALAPEPGEQALQPEAGPRPARLLPDPLELAKRSAWADNLKPRNISPLLLKNAGSGDPENAPAGLVAILGSNRFLHKTDEVSSVAYSPDGKYLATAAATWDGQQGTITQWEVKLWEAATGQSVRDFEGHTGAVNSVAFSPDSKRLVTASKDGTARVWDVSTAKERFRLDGHTGRVRTAAFNPNGKWIATGGDEDRKVILWEAATGARKLTFENHTGEVLHVTFSPDSSRVASSSAHGDASVRIWETETGTEIVRLVTNAPCCRAAVFSHDGKRVVSVGDHATSQVWDVATGQTVFDLKGHTNLTLGVACSPDGKHFATASLDGTVKIWDAEGGRLLHSYPARFRGAANVAFSPDGKQLASGEINGQVQIHDVAAGRTLFSGHTGQVFAVAVSPEGRLLASAGEDQTVRLWDLSTGELLHTLIGRRHAVYAVHFSPDGKRLASAGGDGTVRLWDAVAGKELQTLVGHVGSVRGVAFSPDGQVLASGGEDGAVMLWDAAAGKPLHAFRSAERGWCVAFSPDSKTLASGHEGALHLWDRATGGGVSLSPGNKVRVRCVAFHPDGRSLASAGGWDRTVRLWDLAASREQRRLEGHLGDVLCCVWRADGRLLASCGGSDGTVRLWDAGDPSRCRVLSLFPSNTKWLHGLAFTPEGRYLATANPDGTLYVLKLAERGVVFRPTSEK